MEPFQPAPASPWITGRERAPLFFLPLPLPPAGLVDRGQTKEDNVRDSTKKIFVCFGVKSIQGGQGRNPSIAVIYYCARAEGWEIAKPGCAIKLACVFVPEGKRVVEWKRKKAKYKQPSGRGPLLPSFLPQPTKSSPEVFLGAALFGSWLRTA